jgi:hypothetical protein
MMKYSIQLFTSLLLTLILWSCNSQKNYEYPITKNYKPDNQKLYDTIVHLDSVFFNYYNSCNDNLEKYGDFYSENIEFYHDNGGLMTSKKYYQRD